MVPLLLSVGEALARSAYPLSLGDPAFILAPELLSPAVAMTKRIRPVKLRSFYKAEFY